MQSGPVLSACFIAVASLARAQLVLAHAAERLTTPPPPVASAPAPEPVAPPASPAAPAAAPERAPPLPSPRQHLELELDNGTSIRFGVLVQLQYEAAGDFERDVSHNLFMRRMMLLIGGKVLRDFEYFIDTEFVDLFKASGEQSLKNGPGIPASASKTCSSATR
jgi:hypothetical protein